MKINQSPMQAVIMQGFSIFIKRDDLLNPHFSGNKARKFSYFLETDFAGIKKIIGYGSVQANSLYSLAALAELKGWQLDFYVHNIANWLKEKPSGNYRGALALGANIIEVNKKALNGKNLEYFMQQLQLSKDTLFIAEGGRCLQAEQGIKQLAKEILNFCRRHKLQEPVIMLPAGTGTTALFLQKNLPFKVLTCACVGNKEYLHKQFFELEPDSDCWPTVLTTENKYHFGKLYPEFYQIWKELKLQTKIEFDLLYDPLGWITLLDYLQKNNLKQEVIYIHQGGLIGNESMLPRYERKYKKSTE